jgi:hypothetical protein
VVGGEVRPLPPGDPYVTRPRKQAHRQTVDQLTDSQRKEAATAKKAYFAKLGSASAKAIKRNKAERLRALAEKLDAEAGE